MQYCRLNVIRFFIILPVAYLYYLGIRFWGSKNQSVPPGFERSMVTLSTQYTYLSLCPLFNSLPFFYLTQQGFSNHHKIKNASQLIDQI